MSTGSTVGISEGVGVIVTVGLIVFVLVGPESVAVLGGNAAVDTTVAELQPAIKTMKKKSNANK
jgi:hypothetical protein